jgi:thiamine kinase-like enzyme
MEKDTVSVFKGMPFILYEFVGGVNPKKLTRGMYEELGNIISELHNLNISYFKGIKEDKFNFSLENNIYNILKSLEENNFKKRTSSYKLKKLFLENNDFILGIIPFLKKESNYIKKRRKAYVITHGDIHKGNILTGKNGTCIIDWEHLELALPENDIMWFRDNKHFYYSYVNGLKKSYKPDKRAMKFYIIRKGLNEFVFFSTSILYGKNGEKISNKKIKFMKRQFKILKNIFYSQRFK